MKKIRESKVSKVVAYYLMLMMILQVTQPMQVYALTEGPSQPEFNSFTPIGTSDMVDLASGDFNYNIPIMDVGGYPLNLAYNSGVTMDQEASWVGLGWNMSVGQINRQVRGLPDDFDGDPMIYENNMKDNVTIGAKTNVFIAPFGLNESGTLGLKVSAGMGIHYNNYDGVGFSVNGGASLSYDMGNNTLSTGMNLESSSTEGISLSPSVSFSRKYDDKSCRENNLTGSLGLTINSRKGVESLTMSASRSRVNTAAIKGKRDENNNIISKGTRGSTTEGTSGGSISFIDASFTPTKRVGLTSNNVMFSLNVEGAVVGVDPGVKFTGYRNSQGIKDSEKYKILKAYGYENSTNATTRDVLDFNREKDRGINKNTVSLPVTNFTYDLYSTQGQGVNGMFRAYKGQVGYVFDNSKTDDSVGINLGGEIGGGSAFHFGFDLDVNISSGYSGLWSNNALPRLQEKKTGNTPNYEKIFFKNIGGNHVDKDMTNMFIDKLGGYNPISFKISDGSYNRNLYSSYFDKYLKTALPQKEEKYIKRGSNRLNRGQIIQKISRSDSKKYDLGTFSPYSKSKQHKHHTSAIRVVQDGGTIYNYGRAAYNVIKKEVSFDLSVKNNPIPDVNCENGLIKYAPGKDNSINNGKDGDQFFERITTPSYAHTFLLTSILSSDYQDIERSTPETKGPSDGDLGTYTKFSYTNKSSKATYKWRVPFNKDMANFDEGIKSLFKDNKGNYQYGEKELLYIEKIVTKTHIAIFSISKRNDGYGVIGENGGIDDSNDSSAMWKLDKISLYSKPEYLASKSNAIPIKVAHFEYDYSLCQGIDNNKNNGSTSYIGQQGKLTLKKLYFTYRDSKMGKYTPYTFYYGNENKNIKDYSIINDPVNNPKYDMKAYDIWGNYKPNESNGCNLGDKLSNAEFPYVDQSNKATIDGYASAWLLKSINLPSGGQMNIEFESDDYQYVQDKEAMQMFKVIGAGKKDNPSSSELTHNQLYENGLFTEKINYLYIKLDKPCEDKADFYSKYIRNLIGQNIYFRFLLNMTTPSLNANKYDYVTGYLNIVNANVIKDQNGLYRYAALEIKMTNRGGGFTDPDNKVNPISKAGWFFGRQHLNALMYSKTADEGLDITNIKGVIFSLLGLIGDLKDILKSPNRQLISREIAKLFVPGKSWIRLMHPDGKKLGGGSRVKSLHIKDNWDIMTNHLGDEVYAQFYGQNYTYTVNDDPNSKSSGVASYEPLGCKENPLVQPFYDEAHKETLLGGDVNNYVELPFGESFYPSPNVTYSRVKVNNLPRKKQDNSEKIITLKKHATGHVVSEFFTTRDYPTISDITSISAEYDKSDLAKILNINVKTHLAMSQGFVVHTNDMDGKSKSQWVYGEDQKDFISGMEYKYEVLKDDEPNKGKLNNQVITIDAEGNVSDKNIVGVDYDVINDFRHNVSESENPGIHFNTEGMFLLIFITVMGPVPSYSYHENVLKTAVTTKTIHSSGILRETIAYDIGAKVSTKNLAWDADTGQVLVTSTQNEYNDTYYNFNFPAYWSYKGMSQAALNNGLTWDITGTGGIDTKYKFNTYNADDYLIDGDEVWVSPTEPLNRVGFKAWVVNVKPDHTFDLIDGNGLKAIEKEDIKNRPTSDIIKKGSIKVIKSGYKNLATASMASITLMKNPLFDSNNKLVSNINGNLDEKGNYNPFLTSSWENNRIVNASAVLYQDLWVPPCECGLPLVKYKKDEKGKTVLDFEYDNPKNGQIDPKGNAIVDFDLMEDKAYNPYRYNILGNWRAVKSYAYLTGRNTTNDPTPRKTGFFTDFKPFYVYKPATNNWESVVAEKYDGNNRWTFASQVSSYNAWGQEVENKDALNRYSAALYGYNNRFPTAVAANSKYKEVASDGFEDYDFSPCNIKKKEYKTHFSYHQALQTNRVSITDKESHTGRKSIRLEPGTSSNPTKATIQKKVVNCQDGSNITAKQEKVASNSLKK